MIYKGANLEKTKAYLPTTCIQHGKWSVSTFMLIISMMFGSYLHPPQGAFHQNIKKKVKIKKIKMNCILSTALRFIFTNVKVLTIRFTLALEQSTITTTKMGMCIVGSLLQLHKRQYVGA